MVEAGNVEPKESTPSSPQDFNPRSYQIQVYKAALTRNTIAVLETGAGKTMIAVMLMKEIGRLMKENGDKGLIIFLAPQVSLVNQQFKVIKDHTDFKAAEYYRDKGVDNWTVECWEKEFSTQEVMVMTPQILLDALRNAFLTLDMVRLLIFDECHRASGKHPYTRIMKEFYHTSDHRPKVFGMTASPVVRKGVSSARDCQGQIGELESILDSKVCTVEDRHELEQSVPSAKDINRFYGAKLSLHEDLKEKLKLSLAKSDTLVGQLHELPQFRDTDDMIKRLKKRLLSQHEKILYCLDHLGLICAHEGEVLHFIISVDAIPEGIQETDAFLQINVGIRYTIQSLKSLF